MYVYLFFHWKTWVKILIRERKIDAKNMWFSTFSKLALRARLVNPALDPGESCKGLVETSGAAIRARLATVRAKLATVRARLAKVRGILASSLKRPVIACVNHILTPQVGIKF